MDITPSSRIFQAERIAARVIDGQALVVMIDDRQLHTLNDVGTFVWERADGRTLDELIQGVVETFDVEHSKALADVSDFVRSLVKIGAIQVR